MKVGRVKWYGSYNYDRGDFNEYGFLQQSSEVAKDIYFHKNGISSGSRFLKKNRAGQFVVYEEVLSKKNGKAEAVNVKLLEELDTEEQKQIYEQYKNDTVIQNELRRLYPWLYLGENVSEYFEPVYANETVYELFRKRYHEKYFKTSVIAELKEWIACRNFFASAADRDAKKHVEKLIEGIDWSGEPLEAVVAFAKTAKRKWFSIGLILDKRPEVLFASEELLGLVERADIADLPFGEIAKDTKCIEFILANIRPYLREDICNRLSDNMIADSEKIIPYVNDKRLSEIMAGIDYTDFSNQEKYKSLFAVMEADIYECAATDAVSTMWTQGMLLELSWWRLLTDSAKVRSIIYASNFVSEKGLLEDRVKDIRCLEEQNNNRLVTVLLDFLEISLSEDDVVQKQAMFLNAHNRLMEYIADSFSGGGDISHGLNTLLDKCHQGYGKRMYFCDARIWEKGNAVWCPEGYQRPNFNINSGRSGRTVCQYHNKADLSMTKYKKSGNYKDQYFADFLMNLGFVPELTSISVKNTAEYPYRIAAYVNRLIDMRPHMKCSKCSKPFYPDFKYAKLKTAKLAENTFYCPDLGARGTAYEHDNKVYLNFCYHCNNVIDSRECRIREKANYGQYLCMRCGGAENTQPGSVCPWCGNTDKNLLEMKDRARIICHRCHYDSVNFVSRFEREAMHETEPVIIIPEGIEEIPFD